MISLETSELRANMKNSKTVLIDRNPGRNSQTYGIARELNTEMDLIHEPSIGVVGNKGDSQCYMGVEKKVQTIHEKLRQRIGFKPEQLKSISSTRVYDSNFRWH